MKDQIIIRCQFKEWYGDEDKVGVEGEGRHKNKGGSEFILDMDIMTIIYAEGGEEGFLARFNAEHDKVTNFYRHQAVEVEGYYAPNTARVIDGKVELYAPLLNEIKYHKDIDRSLEMN